ncbi:class I SAM-dependent methyltransferase [Cyclobacteriaceae bacterium]|jgi:tellurite methyltransferase|nr:class I SAM-dependent methyltransferase [Cyclobacteriaceae bacterium]MDC1516486.1 class I SAM-dependent methyltransferase [Cyclobacteriaceae bacterium]|tara:strand:+ start:689 stop:1297 length:609 start_codon:yes stop_codon:yes gene_type:complete
MKLDDINNFIGDIDLELLDQLLKGRFNDRHRLLEIGCGQGRNIIPFLNLKKAIYGIDLDDKNIALCKIVATSLGGNPSFFSKAHAHTLPFENGFFDAVINCRVMHFAKNNHDFKQQWEEQFRVLRKGGFLYLSMDTSIHNEEIVQRTDGERSWLNDQSERLLLSEQLFDLVDLHSGFQLLEPLKTLRFDQDHAHAILCLHKK